MNLDASVTEWVKSYLSGRQQRIYANGSYSDFSTVTQGVPQGSVLGPLFYIVYANDLSNVVKNCKFVLYADDTVLYISGKDIGAVVKKLQEDIDAVANWCAINGITANTEKTKVMIFGSRNTLANASLSDVNVKFGDAPLQLVTSYSYLGVTLDNQLNYNLHVSLVVRSVTNKLNQFRRMRKFLTTKAALLVYKGMLLPILEYGDIFLTGASVANRKRLQILQNKGLRCALNKGIDTSINEPVSKLSVRTRSSKKVLLRVKLPRTETFKKSLAYLGAKMWNGLSEDFHYMPSKASYKSKISAWIDRKATINASMINILDCSNAL